MHPYQIHSAAISKKLREFFTIYNNNSIKFWDCPSNLKWPLHAQVDNEVRNPTSTPIFPHKSLWDFCSKCDIDSINTQWKMLFQASDSRGRNFLELLDDDLNPIEPLAIKGSPWLQHFRYSNLLCAQATRAIVNHTPIKEYQLHFFPREEFSCPCRCYLIESRHHILHECRRYNNYWNSRRDTISHFTLFLEFNSNAFSFG